MVLAYITCKDKKEAKSISLHLLKMKLIACGNIFPIDSMYFWKDKIVNEKESVLLVKTNSKNFNKVVNEVKKIHSYEVPCILKIDAKANKEYNNFVDKQVN
jgi:periplasmic divalent cation tolerance protein